MSRLPLALPKPGAKYYSKSDRVDFIIDSLNVRHFTSEQAFATVTVRLWDPKRHQLKIIDLQLLEDRIKAGKYKPQEVKVKEHGET